MMTIMSPPIPRPGPAPLRILLADDNEVFRATIRGLLRRLGHTVTAVEDGRRAIEAASREEFDLVFLDVQMPEVDGFQAARSMRLGRDGAASPRIIGLSADDPRAGLAPDCGMDDFLLKPVRLADLVHALGCHRPA